MKAIEVDPLQSDRWNILLTQYETDVFHSPAWLEVLAKTYDFSVRAKLLLDDDEKPIAGMAFVKIDDIFSPRIVSVPFSDFCDPLVREPVEWEKLTALLFAEKIAFSVRSLHCRIPQADPRFERVNRANWHGCDLDDSLDSIYSRIHSSSRRAIRKAEKAGVSIRLAENENDLRAFFDMHLKIRKNKYRLLAQSFRFLQNIWQNFVEKGQGDLILAEWKGKIIGGVFFLKWRDRLYYKFNASAAEQQNVRPNDLLMWHGIQYGKKCGAKFLDLGLSDWGQDGLVRYKKKYATEEKMITFLRYQPDGAGNAKDMQIHSLLPQLTDLLTDADVPNAITEKAGDLLYRFFT